MISYERRSSRTDMPNDEEIAEILRRTQKPVLVAANKADHMGRVDDAVEFYGLGLGEVFAISAIHGLGVGDLLDAVFTATRCQYPYYKTYHY